MWLRQNKWMKQCCETASLSFIGMCCFCSTLLFASCECHRQCITYILHCDTPETKAYNTLVNFFISPVPKRRLFFNIFRQCYRQVCLVTFKEVCHHNINVRAYNLFGFFCNLPNYTRAALGCKKCICLIHVIDLKIPRTHYDTMLMEENF